MKNRHVPLILLILLHVVFAAWYAAITPYRTSGVIFSGGGAAKDIGAPDERQHANYVQNLIDGKGFPVLAPGSLDLGETLESHQPPLYYLLAAGVAKVAGVTNVDNQEGIRLRYLNVLIGGATVAGAFFLALWGLKNENLGYLAAAFVALMPMSAALSGAINNDPLLFCLCTWSLAVCALAITDGWTVKRAVTLGVLVGLAFITKTTAIALAPALLAGIILARKSTPIGKPVYLAVGLALLIALPWWLRNQSLYGDPFAIKAFNSAFTGNPTPQTLPKLVGHDIPMSDYFINWVGWFTVRSFIGVFGYMDIFLGNTFYRLVFAALILLAFAGIAELRKDQWKPYSAVHWMNGVFIAVVVLLFVRFNLQYFQGQARYVYPAIGPIAIGFALGLLYVAKGRWKEALALVVVVLGGINLWVLQYLPGQFEIRAHYQEMSQGVGSITNGQYFG